MTFPEAGDHRHQLWSARERARTLRDRLDAIDLEPTDELADDEPAGDAADDAVEALEDELADVDELIDDHSVQVALLGDTNAGKSTLVNALLGRQLLPSSNSGPGTAVVTTVRYRPGATITVEITFATRADLRRACQQLADQLALDDPDDEIDLDMHDLLDASRRRLTRIFGPSLDEYLASGHVSHLHEVPDAAKLLDEGRRVVEADSAEEVHRVLLASADASAAIGYLVDRVDIAGEFAPLRSGITVVDLPGLNDPDARRTEATRRFVADAEIVWVVFPLDTGLNKSTIRAVQSMVPLHQLLLDERASALRFVCTKTEDVGAEQARRLGLAADATTAEQTAARDAATRADIATKIDLLVRPIERRLADAAPDAAQRLRDSPVHLVSAFESLRVDDALERSGIGALRVELHDIGEQLISADAVAAIEADLDRIAAAIDALEHGVRSDPPVASGTSPSDGRETDAATASFVDVANGAVDDFARELAAHTERFVSELADHGAAAFSRLDDASAAWSTMTPRTLHATILRRGAFTSQGGVHHDLNADIAQAFFLAVQAPWKQYFRGDAPQLVDTLLSRITSAYAESPAAFPAASSGASDAPSTLVRELHAFARDAEADIQLAVVETVRGALVADYDRLARNSGIGVRLQLVHGLADAVQRADATLLDDVVACVRRWLASVHDDLVAAARRDVAQLARR